MYDNYSFGIISQSLRILRKQYASGVNCLLTVKKSENNLNAQQGDYVDKLWDKTKQVVLQLDEQGSLNTTHWEALETAQWHGMAGKSVG